jgi:tRNA modification GTPase
VNAETDTIAAIATAPGESAVSIIRISGPSSLAIADRVFRCSGPPPSARHSYSFVHGWILPGDVGTAPSAGVVDEVILLVYRAPHSYTREDVVEIQGHGGSTAAKRILRSVLDCGARLATPGEFTKRAFLNGRIDLLQAEAVADLIRAGSDRAAAVAVQQLEGNLSNLCTMLYDCAMSVAADVEACLDFQDDELPASVRLDARDRLSSVFRKMSDLLATWDEGHFLRDGVLVVISGKPNVGKSTLLNALLGRDRAIVTEIPGTTRDSIEETCIMNGFPVRLVDTAGLRDSQCAIENEGIRRARALMGKADIHLHVIDGSVPLDDDVRKQISEMDPSRTVVVANKCDLGLQVSEACLPGFTVVTTSLLLERGVDTIREALLSKIHVHPDVSPHVSISERHRQLLNLAKVEFEEAMSLIGDSHGDASLAASRLRSGLIALGEITGRIYTDELLDAVFARFCVGK